MAFENAGIAKGWIAQKIIDFLTTQNIEHALADAGGDISMSTAPEGTNGWTIGVNIPERREELLDESLLLQNKAVATSGDAYQYVEKDGKRYSHIIDPKPSLGITWQRNVTVIVKDGTVSDWLATACSVLSEKKAFRLARRVHAALLITEVVNDKLVEKSSADFKSHFEN